jgi:single-strand DNA-binding protein
MYAADKEYFLTPKIMKSINQVMLLGNLAADPEEKETKTGKKITSISLATDQQWTSKDGEKQKRTNFHRIIAWEQLGAICKKFLKKGSAVFVTGRLSNRTYEDQNGKNQYITEVVADDINILSWKKSEEGGSQLDIENMRTEV